MTLPFADWIETGDRIAWDDPSPSCDFLAVLCFEFGTPGSSMSILFMESESICATFVELLESFRGVYGLLDMEDMRADLLWLRGEKTTHRELRRRLETGDIGPPLPEGELRQRATALARHNGGDLVTAEHIARVIHEATS